MENLVSKILAYIVSVLTIIINVIFILIGILFYLEGNLLIAIVIWILVIIEKIIVIYLLVKLLDYYRRRADQSDGVIHFPDATCLIFLGIIMGAAFMISLVSYSIL